MMFRLETGDVYPPYSSLRSDPLGTKILFESLEKCCDLKVERNYLPFQEIKSTKSTVFFMGLGDEDLDSIPGTVAKDINHFVENGGRLVLTFLPRNETFLQGSVKKAIKNQQEKAKEKKEKDQESEFEPKSVSIPEEWDFEFANLSLPEIGQVFATLRDPQSSLPSKISCHTSLYFRKVGSEWNVIYERDGMPVILERAVGKGTIVLSTLSFFLSNEAMLKERHPALLAWIVGNQPGIIFDEYHNGIMASPGVASLARKYQLEGLFFGILILAGLFLWKSSSPLVPPYSEDGTESDFARGKESAEGLMNLLRRNIPARQLLSVCYQEWKKSVASKGLTKRKLEQIDSIIEAQNQIPVRQRNQLSTYNRISEVIKERG